LIWDTFNDTKNKSFSTNVAWIKLQDAYRITAMLKVETDSIANISASPV